MRKVRLLVLGCGVGAVAVLVTAAVTYFGLALIPGTPNNALVRAAMRAASSGKSDVFMRYFLSPEFEATNQAATLWYLIVGLPASVIAGTVIAFRLSRTSLLCSVVGGPVPAFILTFEGPLDVHPDTRVGAIATVVIVALAWVGSLALLRISDNRRRAREGLPR